MSLRPVGFAARVVAWQRAHGRSGLPWQGQRDPYRVWLSEIMLQQTQVATALPYYARFLQRFADVASLADAPLDDVLALWSGLGYYSRARNLHRCAQAVVREHGGAFPRSASQLQTLPGIGPSTAAAIAAFCFGERAAILDGNVKRVLARVLAFGDDQALAASGRALWAHAQAMLPAARKDMPAYTQGVMDLGATVCLARKPLCLLCPVEAMCQAHQQGLQEALPVKTRSLRRGAETWWMLLAQRGDGAVWLQRRPDSGVWAGLYAAPMYATPEQMEAVLTPAMLSRVERLQPFKHTLTHKDLHLHPMRLRVAGRLGLQDGGAWHTPSAWPGLGLPAPVRKLLGSLNEFSPAPTPGAA